MEKYVEIATGCICLCKSPLGNLRVTPICIMSIIGSVLIWLSQKASAHLISISLLTTFSIHGNLNIHCHQMAYATYRITNLMDPS